MKNAKDSQKTSLLTVMLLWIENIELFDSNCLLNIDVANTENNLFISEDGNSNNVLINLEKITKLFLNNILYITINFWLTNKIELSLIWKRIASSFSGNIYIIVHYLFVIISLSHNSTISIVLRIVF